MSFTGELYTFQKEAMARMVSERTLLLAFEMGLGKTPTTIAALEELIEGEEAWQGLIVVPSSLKYQWQSQIDAFTDVEDAAIVIDGTKTQRKKQYAEAMLGGYSYVILSYTSVVNDWDDVSQLQRDFVVLDEATYIKNFRAQRTKKVKRLTAPYRFALSGQPVENRPEEVYSIMEWVDKDVLGRFDIFDKTFIARNGFGGVQYYKNLPTLHKRLGDAMARRTREEVKDQLPNVVETVEPVLLDRKQAALYKRIAGLLLADLEQLGAMGVPFSLSEHYGKSERNGNPAAFAVRGQAMAKMMALRMLCDHPLLISNSADLFTRTAGEEGAKFAAQLSGLGWLDSVPKESPKLARLMEMLDGILDAPDNKVVVFSYFKGMLGFMRDWLRSEGIGCSLYTGDMNAKEKEESKRCFQTDPNVRVLLSSDAGGYGVDLPQANYLISYDLPWSAGALEQRNARIVRLSSTWERVDIISMQVAGSIEERQHAMLRQKMAIAAAVVDGKGHSARGQLTLDLKSLTEHLSTSSVTLS